MSSIMQGQRLLRLHYKSGSVIKGLSELGSAMTLNDPVTSELIAGRARARNLLVTLIAVRLVSKMAENPNSIRMNTNSIQDDCQSVSRTRFDDEYPRYRATLPSPPRSKPGFVALVVQCG